MAKVLRCFLLLVIVFSAFSCAQKKMTITILFKQIGDLTKNSPVYLDDVMIGNVKKIKLQGNRIAVKVLIFGDYKDTVKMKSDFYNLGKSGDAHILIVIKDPKSVPLSSGSVVKGSSKTDYWLDKGTKVAKDVFDKGMKKAKEYFKSDEWKKLKTDISRQIDIAAKKGKKELDKQLPILKEKALELYKDSPEILNKVKTYIDSLSNEKKQANNE